MPTRPPALRGVAAWCGLMLTLYVLVPWLFAGNLYLLSMIVDEVHRLNFGR